MMSLLNLETPSNQLEPFFKLIILDVLLILLCPVVKMNDLVFAFQQLLTFQGRYEITVFSSSYNRSKFYLKILNYANKLLMALIAI